MAGRARGVGDEGRVLRTWPAVCYVAVVTLTEFLTMWLARGARDRVSGRTFQRYEGIVRQHLVPALGDAALADLTPLEIQAYYADALRRGRSDGSGGLAATTVLQHHRVLRRALARAVRWGLIESNPADAVDPPRPVTKDIAVLDEAEAAGFMRALSGCCVYVPLVLALGTGMRRGEILALAWGAVDLKRQALAVTRSLEQTRGGLSLRPPKTRRGRRRIDLPGFVVETLLGHRREQDLQAHSARSGGDFEDHGLVCPLRSGRPWPPDSFSAEFARQLSKAGLRHIRFHDIRHSHASHLLRQGVHPKVVSERLGHSSVGITLDTYSHLLPGMQAEAAARVDRAIRGALG